MSAATFRAVTEPGTGSTRTKAPRTRCVLCDYLIHPVKRGKGWSHVGYKGFRHRAVAPQGAPA